jgi:hypothetical protein
MPLGWLKGRLRPTKAEESSYFDRYVSSAPSWQNAVNAVAGWNTAFPPHYGITAGPVPTHGDQRIIWALECFGPLVDRHVLELGPLEGGHTSMLESAGARVDAIEANELAFLRCLIRKEIVGLTRSKFWLGDFVKALETSDQRYDLIIACGVLYHLKDPLGLIDLVAKRADALYLWTHVMTDAVMPQPDDPRRPLFDQTAEKHPFHDIEVRAYRRSYVHADQNVAFCGGMADEHRWLHRDDLMEALKAVGFQDIRVAHDDPDHRYGPSLSVFARK